MDWLDTGGEGRPEMLLWLTMLKLIGDEDDRMTLRMCLAAANSTIGNDDLFLFFRLDRIKVLSS